MKRKSDQNLNILAQEGYFEHIAERSAYHDFNKKYCNEEQQYVHEDHDIDITFYNDLISNNEYCNGMFINILMIFAPIL